MINVICEKCGKELILAGGLVFSPPRDSNGQVFKRHLCIDCYSLFLRWLYKPTTDTGADVENKLVISEAAFNEISDLMFDGNRQFFFECAGGGNEELGGVMAISMKGIRIEKAEAIKNFIE